MNDAAFRYCDVALPVPVDRLFTYELPLPLRHDARPGCRAMVPFGSRKLIGVVLRTHDDTLDQDLREVLSVVDAEPVLDEELLQLGKWIAEYYCAPIGEVLRGMLPLTGEMRRSTQYSLTAAGRDVARQLIVKPESDPGPKRAWIFGRAGTIRHVSCYKSSGRETGVAGLNQTGLGGCRRETRRARSSPCTG